MLYPIDIWLFNLINQALSNPLFDWVMPLFDKPKGWIPFILLFWLYMAFRDKKNRKQLLILVPLIILLGDQFGGFIKDFELRDRPWFALGIEYVNHLGGMGGKHKSFPSNHALNVSAMAFLFTYLYPKFKYFCWGFALLIMFSRVYIGVHYPLDIFAGFTIGIFISLFSILLYNKVFKYDH